MTLIWFLVWTFSGYPSVVLASAEGANPWAVWLILAIAVDIGASHAH